MITTILANKERKETRLRFHSHFSEIEKAPECTYVIRTLTMWMVFVDDRILEAEVAHLGQANLTLHQASPPSCT